MAVERRGAGTDECRGIERDAGMYEGICVWMCEGMYICTSVEYEGTWLPNEAQGLGCICNAPVSRTDSASGKTCSLPGRRAWAHSLSLALVGAPAPNRLWCCAHLVPARYHCPRTGTRPSMYSQSPVQCTVYESTKKEREKEGRADGEMVA